MIFNHEVWDFLLYTLLEDFLVWYIHYNRALVSPTSAYSHATLKCTGSRSITEAKQCWAFPVLGWVTAWEQQVL